VRAFEGATHLFAGRVEAAGVVDDDVLEVDRFELVAVVLVDGDVGVARVVLAVADPLPDDVVVRFDLEDDEFGVVVASDGARGFAERSFAERPVEDDVVARFEDGVGAVAHGLVDGLGLRVGVLWVVEAVLPDDVGADADGVEPVDDVAGDGGLAGAGEATDYDEHRGGVLAACGRRTVRVAECRCAWGARSGVI